MHLYAPGRKSLHMHCLWCLLQIWGMHAPTLPSLYYIIQNVKYPIKNTANTPPPVVLYKYKKWNTRCKIQNYSKYCLHPPSLLCAIKYKTWNTTGCSEETVNCNIVKMVLRLHTAGTENPDTPKHIRAPSISMNAIQIPPDTHQTPHIHPPDTP